MKLYVSEYHDDVCGTSYLDKCSTDKERLQRGINDWVSSINKTSKKDTFHGQIFEIIVGDRIVKDLRNASFYRGVTVTIKIEAKTSDLYNDIEYDEWHEYDEDIHKKIIEIESWMGEYGTHVEFIG